MSHKKKRFGDHGENHPVSTTSAAMSQTAFVPQPAAAMSQTAFVPQPAAAPSLRPLRKDQQRALSAYAWADKAKRANQLDDYEIAVQAFAATLLRSGFAAAVSVLERNAKRDGFERLLDNLASCPLPGIPAADPNTWPGNVRALADVSRYMQATRELLALLAWLRRACRALGAETQP
jgi:hypothetical protein